MPVPPQIEYARRQVAVLHEIGQILGAATQFEDALHDILELLCDRMEMSLGTISLLHQEEGQVAVDIAYGLTQSEKERGRYKIGEGITGRVVAVSSFMKVAARMNSFQAVMKENSPVTALAGLASGRMMVQKMRMRLAPSMMADSSSSLGIVSK